MICTDSRRMWRIIENLFQNICKYALEGTRVYLEMQVKDGRVIASLKNISDRPMNLKGEELSERFIREMLPVLPREVVWVCILRKI